MNPCDHETEVCPYDKSHMIVKSRMLRHLARCSKNFADCEKKRCVYNNKHVIPAIEEKYHLENCPDRFKIDTYTMKVGEVECPVKNEVPINIDLPPSEENWDDDPPVECSVLDTIKDYANKNVLITSAYIGKSKRQRKDLRKLEILRHSQLNSKGADNKPVADQLPVVSSPSNVNVYDTNPLRPPRGLNSTSSKIHHILKKREEICTKSDLTKNPVKMPATTNSSGKNIVELSEDIKNIKISSGASDNGSESSRLAELSSKSYASFLARQQQLKQKAKSESGKAKSLSNNHEDGAAAVGEMTKLTSSVFENGPRGRGRPSNASPTMSSNLSSPLSYHSSNVNFTTDLNFATDEHGFLDIPIPGKGRGKIIPK